MIVERRLVGELGHLAEDRGGLGQDVGPGRDIVGDVGRRLQRPQLGDAVVDDPLRLRRRLLRLLQAPRVEGADVRVDLEADLVVGGHEVGLAELGTTVVVPAEDDEGADRHRITARIPPPTSSTFLVLSPPPAAGGGIAPGGGVAPRGGGSGAAPPGGGGGGDAPGGGGGSTWVGSVGSDIGGSSLLCSGQRPVKSAWPGPLSMKLLMPIAASSVANESTKKCLFEHEAVGQRPVESLIDGRLGQPLTGGGSGGQTGGPGHRPVEQLVGGDHGIDEADRQGLVGPDLPTGEDQVLGPGGADQTGQALGAATAGDDAEQDLGLAPPGGVGAHAEVAGQRQLTATTEREPVHGGDGGPGDRRHGVEGVEEGLAVGGDVLGGPDRCRALVGVVEELADLGPGGEDPVTPGDDHRARWILGELDRRSRGAGSAAPPTACSSCRCPVGPPRRRRRVAPG